MVVAPILRPVRSSGIWLVALVARAPGTKQLTSKLLRITPTPSTRRPARTHSLVRKPLHDVLPRLNIHDRHARNLP
jgi:hypothetical protein